MIQRLLEKLEEQDAEFKKYHYAIVELWEEEDDLEEEQAKLDDHDDRFYKSSPASCWEKGEWTCGRICDYHSAPRETAWSY